jgi:hypothetical protein
MMGNQSCKGIDSWTGGEGSPLLRYGFHEIQVLRLQNAGNLCFPGAASPDNHGAAVSTYPRLERAENPFRAFEGDT